MLTRATIGAAIALLALACSPHASAQASRLGGYRVRAAVGSGVGHTATLYGYPLSESPEGVGVVGEAGLLFPYRLYVGVDVRWFHGTPHPADVPLHYRATRATVDVGVEIGENRARLRTYLGVGYNAYRLVVDDLRMARSGLVLAPGMMFLMGNETGFFGSIDFRAAQIVHRLRGQTLAPTDGYVDSSFNLMLSLGWTFAVADAAPREQAVPREERPWD